MPSLDLGRLLPNEGVGQARPSVRPHPAAKAPDTQATKPLRSGAQEGNPAHSRAHTYTGVARSPATFPATLSTATHDLEVDRPTAEAEAFSDRK